ncbi:MAG: tripartite tricarboxylate transporter substrate binding protein [Burkholderiales bacterium]|nr:tripartite tricarboxylate transporter substrate binding protein [Burkholderiales bacterium]
MKTKLTLLVAVAGLAGVFAPAVVAQNTAAAYPNKPVRWIVPFPPGASNDITARLFAQKMSVSMGQQFVIDNRPGAGGSIGAQLAAEAAPDGYTLLHANPGPSVNNIIMRRKSPYQISDFAPVMFIGYTPLLILANPKFVASNGRELAAYAKANPGKLTWASSGNGSSLHIGLALFGAATGLEFVHVPYKGTVPAITDVISGRVDVMHTTVVSADAHIKSGRVKVLAVAAPARQAVLPNVPTLAEEGIKNAEATVWFGVQVAAKTPRTLINRLNAEMNRVLQMPDVQARLDQLGLVKAGGTPEDFGAFIKNEADKLRMLIKSKRVDMMD